MLRSQSLTLIFASPSARSAAAARSSVDLSRTSLLAHCFLRTAAATQQSVLAKLMDRESRKDRVDEEAAEYLWRDPELYTINDLLDPDGGGGYEEEGNRSSDEDGANTLGGWLVAAQKGSVAEIQEDSPASSPNTILAAGEFPELPMGSAPHRLPDQVLRDLKAPVTRRGGSDAVSGPAESVRMQRGAQPLDVHGQTTQQPPTFGGQQGWDSGDGGGGEAQWGGGEVEQPASGDAWGDEKGEPSGQWGEGGSTAAEAAWGWGDDRWVQAADSGAAAETGGTGWGDEAYPAAEEPQSWGDSPERWGSGGGDVPPQPESRAPKPWQGVFTFSEVASSVLTANRPHMDWQQQGRRGRKGRLPPPAQEGQVDHGGFPSPPADAWGEGNEAGWEQVPPEILRGGFGEEPELDDEGFQRHDHLLQPASLLSLPPFEQEDEQREVEQGPQIEGLREGEDEAFLPATWEELPFPPPEEVEGEVAQVSFVAIPEQTQQSPLLYQPPTALPASPLVATPSTAAAPPVPLTLEALQIQAPEQFAQLQQMAMQQLLSSLLPHPLLLSQQQTAAVKSVAPMASPLLQGFVQAPMERGIQQQHVDSVAPFAWQGYGQQYGQPMPSVQYVPVYSQQNALTQQYLQPQVTMHPQHQISTQQPQYTVHYSQGYQQIVPENQALPQYLPPQIQSTTQPHVQYLPHVQYAPQLQYAPQVQQQQPRRNGNQQPSAGGDSFSTEGRVAAPPGFGQQAQGRYRHPNAHGRGRGYRGGEAGGQDGGM